jgi:ribosomal protein S18 acetylase RimI-like enzyme
LRDATLADAAAIAALHAANWRRAYADVLNPAYLAGQIDADRLMVWTGRLTAPDPAQEVVVAEAADGSLAGFTCLYHASDPQWGALVDNLHSSAATRGTGVGRALLSEAARRVAARDPASGIWLWVYEKNLPACGFYEALGGTIVERKVQDWEAAAGQILLRCHWPSAVSLAKAANR